MLNHFAAIGFAGEGKEELSKLAELALERGRAVDSPLGRYLLWPSGPEEQLWAQVDRRGAFAGLNPHFEGSARLRAVVHRAVRDSEWPMEGNLSCSASPTGDDPESGEHPLIVAMPDFDASVPSSLPVIGNLQIAAFAHDLICWPSDEEYYEAETQEIGSGRELKVRWAAESFVPTGMFRDEARLSGKGPEAMAMITGHALSAELRSNRHSGRHYWHIRTGSLGGEYDIVADPGVVEGNPQEGGVLRANCWLSARLTGDLVRIPRPSLAGRLRRYFR